MAEIVVSCQDGKFRITISGFPHLVKSAEKITGFQSWVKGNSVPKWVIMYYAETKKGKPYTFKTVYYKKELWLAILKQLDNVLLWP